ncbi:DUF4913 domain-containing protein [Streptomyces sp. Y1]|uniref:DUF4913 domain-containing protein n=1 Tax=Streptomyces sp. Y1 TaxID=3238634 RepID=A0AB39TVF8_9ACTN
MADEVPYQVLAEDVEDLKALLQAVQAELQALREAGSREAEPANDRGKVPDRAEEEQDESSEWRFPPFLFLLEGEALGAELRLLAEWVESVLVPGCLAEVSANARWCHRWIEHWDAVGVLHAMWLAWQELTNPATCGLTGPSLWYRDHYRPHITDLRGPGGPFAGCTKGEHRTEHRLPGTVPSTWYTDVADV